MLYLFYGDDSKKARAKWHAVINSFQTKQPEGTVFRFNAEDFNTAQFVELISASDLFGEKRLIVGDRVLENETAQSVIADNLAELVNSPNTFVLLETEVDSDLVKKIKKVDGKLEEHNLALKSAAPPFNIFAINDALIARDRKHLWLVYQQALKAGLSTEEIFWKLAWQIKTMLIVGKQRGEIKTLKPFVLGKAKRGLTKFKIEELEDLSGELVNLWHEARRGVVDFDLGLERLILAV